MQRKRKWLIISLTALVLVEGVVLLLVATGGIGPGGPVGGSFLRRAARAGDIEEVRRQIAAGADVNARSGGDTALGLALLNDKEEMVRFLVENGADPNDGEIQFMARDGREDQVKLLLDLGADPDAGASVNGLTPLMAASMKGHVAVMELLIQRGADVNIRAMFGQTALHIAAEFGTPETVKVLLAHGADPHVADKNGLTALEIAKWNAQQPGSAAIVKLLTGPRPLPATQPSE